MGSGSGLVLEAAGRARGGVVSKGARGADNAHGRGGLPGCVGRELDEHLIYSVGMLRDICIYGSPSCM